MSLSQLQKQFSSFLYVCVGCELHNFVFLVFYFLSFKNDERNVNQHKKGMKGALNSIKSQKSV